MTESHITALIAHDAGVSGDRIADHIPAGSGVTVLQTVHGLSPTPIEVQDSDADVLVVACAELPEDALALVEWWATHRPGRPAIVLCEGSPNGFVDRAFAAGADDLIVIRPGDAVSDETSQELLFALQKAIARRSAPSDVGPQLGTMICVLGPKGGIGKTLTSCNLGLALTDQGHSVVLVDLDLQFGDLALSLGMTPDATIYDLATAGGALDAGKIEAYLGTHPLGMRVLMAPVRPDQASIVTIEFLQELYALLREAFDYVIVDTPPGFTPEVIASIDASSHICMIGMLDALSLKNTKLGLETLELMGYKPERVRLVLNRADSSVGITHNDVITILGRPPDVLVPSNREVTRSVNEGTPIVVSHKRSEAARAFQALAALYTPQAAVPEDNGETRRSLLGRGRS